MRLLVNFLSTALGSKTGPALAWGAALTPVLVFVEKHLFNDWQFLGSLCVLIMVDTVFGVQHHWVQHSISSRAFSRLFTKCGIYLGLLVLTHVLTTYQAHDKPQVLFAWFDTFMYSCMVAREAVSILEHMDGIMPNLIPKGLRKRLALVSEEGIEAGLTAMPVTQPSDAPLNLTPASVTQPSDAPLEPASPLTPTAL